jgi:hypothetical protein
LDKNNEKKKGRPRAFEEAANREKGEAGLQLERGLFNG